MALIERVATLLRANVNDLIERAEDPDKMARQMIVDMENQLMQVKTQLAITIADLHLLDQRRKDSLTGAEDWMRKAGLAVSKQEDNLARLAIERSLENRKGAENFAAQVADQEVQIQNLKIALHRLEGKLAEARLSSELTATERHRRATGARSAGEHPAGELIEDNLDDQFASLEKRDEVERLLQELKTKAV